MIAHAPILSSVSRSSAQRSFCAIVPLPRIDAAVSPTDTPIAVTRPGQYWQISMIGIICIAAASPPSLRAFFSPPGRLLAARACRLGLLLPRDLVLEARRAISSMPKVL